MSRKQAYIYFYASYCDKINQIYDSDIFQLKIGIPDMNILFATLVSIMTQTPPQMYLHDTWTIQNYFN